MREVDADLFHKADACACSVTMMPSKIEHSKAGLWVFSARSFQKGDVTGSYYGALGYYDLSPREPARTGNVIGVRIADVTRFSKYVLQVQVQQKQLEQGHRADSKNENYMCPPASFYACTFINSFRYASKERRRASTGKACWQVFA